MSAVAYVLSGICKDILLVTLGAVLWAEVVTFQQLVGYGIALAGLGYYNYMGKVAAARKNDGGGGGGGGGGAAEMKAGSGSDDANADEEAGAAAALLRGSGTSRERISANN